MTEVVRIGNAELYLGDCRDLLPQIEANSIDMIWTDPPYGHGNHDGDLNARLNEYRNLPQQPIANDDAESMRAVVDAMLKEAARVLRPDACCCCCCGGGGPRPTFAWIADRMDREGLSFFHSVIWDKVNPGLGWRYRRQHEMVMIAHRKDGRLLWADESVAIPNVIRQMPGRERFHPNEKPLFLVERFISAHSKEGQIVLDPFMGSGTTGVACVNLNRRFIGMEIDRKYFDIACSRIEQAQKQQRLFA
jgi:site-specific DNA-methyltransferase (adenine-specific)